MEKEENNLTIPTYLQGLLDASSQGMDTLSHSLSKLLDFPVLVVTHTYEIISSSFFNQNLGEIQVESVVPYEAKNFWFVCTVTSNTKHSKAIGRGITSSDHVIGYLFVLIDDQHLDEAKLTPILDYSASLYATHVQSRKELINEQYRLKNAFLYDMLYGNIKINEDIISMGEIWGLDFRIQHAVLVFILTDFDVHTSDEYLMDNLRLIVERATADLNNKNSAIMVRRNEIILFSPVEDCQSGDKKRFFFRLAKSILAHSMESELQNRVACGIGKTYPFPVDLFRSYQEAKVACEMGRLLEIPIPFFNELGLERILYKHDLQDLREYYSSVLEELHRQDDPEGSYINILESFVKNNFNINNTADSLHMHRNTLRYQLNKIESILCRDLNDSNTRLDITAVLKIKQLHNLDQEFE